MNNLWMCASKKAKDASACQADNIFEESIFGAFRVAWNGVIANKDDLTEKWDDQIENGNPIGKITSQTDENADCGRANTIGCARTCNIGA